MTQQMQSDEAVERLRAAIADPYTGGIWDGRQFSREPLAHPVRACDAIAILARMEAAESRLAQAEAALTEASDAMRMTGLAMEAPCGRITKKHVIYWTSLFYGTSEKIRRLLTNGGE
jgi:hypothetical protein